MSLIDLKCEAEGCWHFNNRVYRFCYCCLNGSCSSFTDEQKREYLQLVKEKEDATDGPNTNKSSTNPHKEA